VVQARLLIVTVVLAAAMVSSGGESGAETRGAQPGAAPRVRLTRVASANEPTAFATRSGDPALYVAEQTGRVIAIRDGTVATTPVLDLTDKVLAQGEQGLLGMTFSPDGSHLYVHYSAPDGATTVDEYAFTPRSGGGTADPGTRRRLLTLAQPQINHNGGQLAFGPDGVLYLGLGDGGAAGDQGEGHASGGNGQSEDTLLGKIVRVDVADGGGAICDLGFRNPWRFSFDRRTGDLWIGDVGQDTWEEIDRLPSDAPCGHNLGWNVFEGRARFRDGDVPGAVKPVAVMSHDDGNCSVIGGYVYRGSAIPTLRGWYVFTDYCNGVLRALRVRRDGTVQRARLGAAVESPSSFGEDERGELYVLSQQDGVYRIHAE
jgi:glucose/arabinose dehydrogenase